MRWPGTPACTANAEYLRCLMFYARSSPAGSRAGGALPDAHFNAHAYRSSPWPASAGAEDASYHAQNPARKGAFVGAWSHCRQLHANHRPSCQYDRSIIGIRFLQAKAEEEDAHTDAEHARRCLERRHSALAPLRGIQLSRFWCIGSTLFAATRPVARALFWCIGSTLFAATRPVVSARLRSWSMVNAAWAARTAHERRISSASA